MNTALFLGFIVATMFIVATPGPSVALASSQAMRFGTKAAVFTVIGDGLGSIVHIVIATIGLQVLISMASSLLPWLQIIGGAYIFYLGVTALKAPAPNVDESAKYTGASAAILSGFLVCVSNPKAIVFFVALFPSFIDPTYNIAFQATIYGIIFVVLDAIFIMGYATIATYVFKRSFAGRVNFNMVSGIGLMLIASILIFKGGFELF